MKTLQGLSLHLWPCWSWSGGVIDDSTWKGSAKTLQGLPLSVLIHGGLINSQLGKDPQIHCKDYLCQCWSWDVGSIQVNLERIHKDFARDYLGQCWILGGSIDSQLGKDLRRHCKDYLCTSDQCWSWGWSIDSQLGKDLQRLWKDYLW